MQLSPTQHPFAAADRLTRSLADFAHMAQIFDAAGVSFVSVTQQFNTTTSMGRLTLNVLLSFAQFEREVTAERMNNGRGAQRPARPKAAQASAEGARCLPESVLEEVSVAFSWTDYKPLFLLLLHNKQEIARDILIFG